MAMAIDSRQQHHQFPSMGYEMKYSQSPQFTNPWASAPASQGQMYSTSLPQTTMSSDMHRFTAHAPNVSSAYSSAQLAAPSLVTDGMNGTRPYGAPFQSSAATTGNTFSSQYASAPYGYQNERRPSHPSVMPTMLPGDASEARRYRQDSFIDSKDRLNGASDAERQQFSDALDASRGMVAMSQSDITPRNIYGASQPTRSPTDSYGFPSSHSTHSSISSASTYPTQYSGYSASEASTGDYSSASESIDMSNSRTLPRPNGLLSGALPPAPQSMMGQFSSKISSGSQKKHKCRVCDKRFTRPSSLQTHMYSHTGEKPFACEVEGCGRHFSVVSNLRRHRKVHKEDGRDHPSPNESD